jgi:nucleotide-binding universal stress UspA family protein
MAFTLEDDETKRALFLGAQKALEALLEQCKERLALLGKSATVSGSIEFASGPGEAVVEKAREMKPDLVVVGSHSKGNITG